MKQLKYHSTVGGKTPLGKQCSIHEMAMIQRKRNIGGRG
jgi:acyl-[acyl carrier protein]--UDP-N-acetylglucosamine O-acyltransferase